MTLKLSRLLLAFLLTSSCSSMNSFRTPASSSVVSNLQDLKDKINSVKEGEVIIVAQNAQFDLTQEPSIEINKSFSIIAENPASLDSKPHFFSHGSPLPLFKILAPNVVIDGLKIEGFEKDAKKEEIIALNKTGIKGVYQFPVTRGLEISATDVVIRNCEIEGFSHAAIFVKEGGAVQVKNNYIHHNQRWGLGYGVALHEKSVAEIFGNRFDYNRHSVAGSGFSGQSYEAHHNYFGPNHNDTPLDMHGGKDRGDGTQIAGKKVDIHHNEIHDCGSPIFIHRGIAEDSVIIRDNVIFYSDPNRVIGYYNGVSKSNLPKNKFVFEGNSVHK